MYVHRLVLSKHLYLLIWLVIQYMQQVPYYIQYLSRLQYTSVTNTLYSCGQLEYAIILQFLFSILRDVEVSFHRSERDWYKCTVSRQKNKQSTTFVMQT